MQHVNGNAWTVPDLDIPRKIELHQPILEELQNVLTKALMVTFEDVVVNIVSCPDLTKKPFNLAARGLHGNAAITECHNSCNLLATRKIWNMQYFLRNFAYNSFLIGRGFGTKPDLPFNGYSKLQGLSSIANFYGELLLQLSMNAAFSQPEQVNNASHLAFAREITKPGRTVIIKEPNQMLCSGTGNFFMSEGRPGQVLEVRAKKRIDPHYDFISIIEDALTSYYGFRNKVVASAKVTAIFRYPVSYRPRCCIIDKGKVLVSLIPNNIPEGQIISSNNLTNWIQYRDINCIESNIVAFGAIINKKTIFEKQKSCHHFYTFSGNKINGHFIKDLTPGETEYVGYFSLAKVLYPLALNMIKHC